MSNPESNKPTAKSGQHPGAKESPASLETFPLRTERPGNVGLANEGRPGLGTRADAVNPGASVADVPRREKGKADAKGGDRPVPKPPEERHEPEEQDPNSLAQEQQRSTGVSGHAGGT
ncbi:MAG TPA: hypothetical protein VHO24_16365 [Opitutaceae bacterium]|nr:hypothetical protein [Opitutaceae bacterium]